MTTLREAAQQALEALEEYQYHGAPFLACDGAVAALKAALAQQAEPVVGIIEPQIKVDSHQTLDDAMQQPRAMAQAYENGYKAGVAHERERCLRLIDDHVRAVDSEDVVRAIKEVQG